jgi:hypothetical protein
VLLRSRHRDRRPVCYYCGCVNRRPKLRIVAPAAASSAEAAAVVAALEQFMRDTAPLPAPPPPARRSPWARASLLEATGQTGDVPWGR